MFAAGNGNTNSFLFIENVADSYCPSSIMKVKWLQENCRGFPSSPTAVLTEDEALVQEDLSSRIYISNSLN